MRGARDDAEQPAPFLQIAAHQNPEAAGKLRHLHQREMVPGRGVVFLQPLVERLGPAGTIHHARRERGDISRNALPLRCGDEIKIGARPQCPAFHRGHKAAQTSARILLVEFAQFGINGVGDLLGDHAPRVPGEVAQQRCREQREQEQIDQRQPERRRADQLAERRHGCIT